MCCEPLLVNDETAVGDVSARFGGTGLLGGLVLAAAGNEVHGVNLKNFVKAWDFEVQGGGGDGFTW